MTPEAGWEEVDAFKNPPVPGISGFKCQSVRALTRSVLHVFVGEEQGRSGVDFPRRTPSQRICRHDRAKLVPAKRSCCVVYLNCGNGSKFPLFTLSVQDYPRSIFCVTWPSSWGFGCGTHQGNLLRALYGFLLAQFEGVLRRYWSSTKLIRSLRASSKKSESWRILKPRSKS